MDTIEIETVHLLLWKRLPSVRVRRQDSVTSTKRSLPFLALLFVAWRPSTSPCRVIPVSRALQLPVYLSESRALARG